MRRQCFSSGTAADGHTPSKTRPSQNWPKITTYDHVHRIFITNVRDLDMEFGVAGALVTPYGDINLDQHCLRLGLEAWRPKVITWTNVNLSLKCLVTFSQEVLLIHDMCSEITFLKLPSNLPRDQQTNVNIKKWTFSNPYPMFIWSEYRACDPILDSMSWKCRIPSIVIQPW